MDKKNAGEDRQHEEDVDREDAIGPLTNRAEMRTRLIHVAERIRAYSNSPKIHASVE